MHDLATLVSTRNEKLKVRFISTRALVIINYKSNKNVLQIHFPTLDTPSTQFRINRENYIFVSSNKLDRFNEENQMFLPNDFLYVICSNKQNQNGKTRNNCKSKKRES